MVTLTEQWTIWFPTYEDNPSWAEQRDNLSELKGKGLDDKLAKMLLRNKENGATSGCEVWDGITKKILARVANGERLSNCAEDVKAALSHTLSCNEGNCVHARALLNDMGIDPKDLGL